VGKKSPIAVLLVALVLFSAVASAEDAKYEGVTPGAEDAANLPPKAEEIPQNALMMTWPGFMMLKDGGSCFFVQTSKRVDVASRKSDGKFELVFRNTQVHLKNTFLPLETQFFDTPVLRATVERKGQKDVVMTLEMREDATPTIAQKKGKDGFNYIFVTFEG
jgi:hypothetical protein